MLAVVWIVDVDAGDRPHASGTHEEEAVRAFGGARKPLHMYYRSTGRQEQDAQKKHQQAEDEKRRGIFILGGRDVSILKALEPGQTSSSASPAVSRLAMRSVAGSLSLQLQTMTSGRGAALSQEAAATPAQQPQSVCMGQGPWFPRDPYMESYVHPCSGRSGPTIRDMNGSSYELQSMLWTVRPCE